MRGREVVNQRRVDAEFIIDTPLVAYAARPIARGSAIKMRGDPGGWQTVFARIGKDTETAGLPAENRPLTEVAK